MLAIKNRNGWGLCLLAACLALLAGCTPAGPRALLEGRELLDAGKYPEAVARLEVATSILTTNAQAWNYLGLASHQAGDPKRAVEAYQRALWLDRDLFEAHFNLGCLLLEQNRPDAAKAEFMACTLRRASSLESWLKLGNAQYRLGELTAAEDSYKKAQRLNANDPEALNGLGLISAQRRRPRDAVAYFQAALKQQPQFAPAVLNLATVLRRDFGDTAGAVQKYQEYLALEPQGASATEVRTILHSLQPKPQTVTAVTPASPSVLPATIPPPTNTAKPAVASAATPPATPVKTSLPPAAARSAQTVAVTPLPNLLPPVSNAPAESVQLPPEPVVRSTPPPVVAKPAVTAAPPVVVVSQPDETAAPSSGRLPPAKPEKRGFFSRLNPFGKSEPKETPLPPRTVTLDPPAVANPGSTATAAPRSFPRYAYRSPMIAMGGNRTDAEAAVERGRQAEQAKRLPSAVQAYQQAVQADPSYFEAQFHLALAHYQARELAPSLVTWENALALRPDSTEARYNFALTLKASGYPLDAAAELERIIEAKPGDARAHLALANICAEPLRDIRRARVHYRRTLELSPQNSQATEIRYWLVANPE